MSYGKLGARVGLLLAVCIAGADLCPAAAPVKLTGSLLGSVTDGGGVPQIGAAVMLYNRYDKLIQKTITNLRGDFLFDSLAPDVYSIRVNMSTFVPAFKRNILIQPGMQSVLAINLASVLSSIELVYTTPKSSALMSDDWKWVLRSALATRPVLRILPELSSERQNTAVFSDTTGVLRVSSGEDLPFASAGNEPDLGTAFALATSVFGSNRLRFSGNLGYALDSAVPTAGFRTTFSRDAGGFAGPEVKLTMQQVSIPVRSGALVGAGQHNNAPALRTLSLTMMDRTQIMDGVELEYGASLDSVTFFDRLNLISPFAKLSYDVGSAGRLSLGYSSGAPPIELLMDAREPHADLQHDLSALSVLPRVSLRDGQAQVLRTQNLEIAYQIAAGSRTFSVATYREIVRNGALTISGADDLLNGFDLMPEISSHSSVFNIGGYTRYGYSAAVTQEIGEDYTFTLAYGSGGALRTDGRVLQSDNPAELRSMIQEKQQFWLTGRVAGVVPVAGTRFAASYQWTDYRALTPAHIYFTQSTIGDAGLNIRVRQPLPSFPGLPGRLEASADLRNLLAQGYLPITTVSGRRMLLTHSPRAVRGGLSFIF